MTEEDLARRQRRAARYSPAASMSFMRWAGTICPFPSRCLCVPATLLAGHAPGPPAADAAAAADGRGDRRRAAHHRLQATVRSTDSDPHFWARRYTFVSAIAGATWGVGALFWFVPGFLPRPGLSQPRLSGHGGDGIHRPLGAPSRLSGAHRLVAGAADRAAAAAGRALCRHDGRAGRAFSARVLISYCHGMARLLDEGIHLRNENASW